MNYEIIQGKVSEIKKDSFSETKGAIKRGNGKIQTKIKTIQTFKLENMDKVFQFKQEALIESGDEVVFITNKKPTMGYYKILVIKNFSKVWFHRGSFGLSWVAVFAVWLILAPIFSLYLASPFLSFIVWYVVSSVVCALIGYLFFVLETNKRALVKKLNKIKA